MKFYAYTFLVIFLLLSRITYGQSDTIKSIEFFTQVIQEDCTSSPFLIKRETYNGDFKSIVTEIYTKDCFLLAQRRVYDGQGLMTERLDYGAQKGKRVYTGKTRYYYDDAQNLTRTVTMNRNYDVVGRMHFHYNKRNEKTGTWSHLHTKSNSLLKKLDDFWFLSIVPSRSRFKYKYFSDRIEILETDKKPKQKFLWVKNLEGQVIDLFRIENKRRRRMLKVTYNPQGQKETATFYALSDNSLVISITGRLKLQAGDQLMIETIYGENGRIDAYKQYLNGELTGMQNLIYLY